MICLTQGCYKKCLTGIFKLKFFKSSIFLSLDLQLIAALLSFWLIIILLQSCTLWYALLLCHQRSM